MSLLKRPVRFRKSAVGALFTPWILSILLLAPEAIRAAPPSFAKIDFLPESRVKIEGDSTARKYSAIASPVDLSGTVQSDSASSTTTPWLPHEIEMTIAVKDLKSGERTLDKHMQENLKADRFPKIEMKLSSFTASKASGTLTVAGVTKPIELEPAITQEGEKLRIKGKKRVLMTDFGMTPPTLMMGTLKTRNEIDISYDVVCLTSEKQKAGK